MQRLHRLRIDFGRFRRRTALEHARGALKERFLPLVDHRRVYAELVLPVFSRETLAQFRP